MKKTFNYIFLTILSLFINTTLVLADNNATCTGVLGGFEEDIRMVLKAVSIIAPLLVIAFSVYEYLLAIINKDADALKKCNSRLIKRIILMIILFFLPSLVNIFLRLLGDRYGVCI